MTSLRHQALKTIGNRELPKISSVAKKISDIFGSHVFGEDAMRQYLSKEAYEGVTAAILAGQKIDRTTANQVATGMKNWAMENGVTHYTHWFQPLTGSTAEKHDSFFTRMGNERGMEKFEAEALVQQEPDASSFPSGGLRTTFEARGYTAWDPSSPAFIMESSAGKTLCIPTIFVSYSGETLDFKSPLMKSQHELEQAAVAVCHFFDRSVTRVVPTLGWEQEYFIIDEELYNCRQDLLMTGRTLLGHAPAKGQQLEDHYFGTIPERVYAFMTDYETEAYKLGIPLKTRHNEVAPGQYECAPHFEEMNIAVDHNQLLMDLMEKIARRHKLRVLFHEKPFAGINGSGKHCNWSLATNEGKNLLSPGRTPKTNLQFLTFFVNTIKAVYDHADVLRSAIASAANDHRLGANEAPPAIISVFIGEYMTKVLNEVEQRVSLQEMSEEAKEALKLDINKIIPDLMLDNTDRNRTSPFAFTGNKFEVRAVGSSANTAQAMYVLNTIVANQLKTFKKDVDTLVKAGEQKDGAIFKTLRKCITEAKPILFEGNNYSEEWEKEAAKRGLHNVKTTPHALDFMVANSTEHLFVSNNIFTKDELHARYEIEQEKYLKKIQIEARTLAEIALTQIMPVAITYISRILDAIHKFGSLPLGGSKPIAGFHEPTVEQNELLKSLTSFIELTKNISNHIEGIRKGVDLMMQEDEKADEIADTREKAIAYCEKVKPCFEKVRQHCDALELVVDDALWPLPKYRELLFIK